MRRFESDFRGHPGIEGLFPPTCAKAPAVTGLKSGELHVRPGRREVVALLERVFQKFLRHHRADGVNARITRPGVAIAIPEKPRHWFVAARLQIASQNISRHGPDRKCRHGLVPVRKSRRGVGIVPRSSEFLGVWDLGLTPCEILLLSRLHLPIL